MSTRSEMYHCFGLGTVEPLKTEFRKGRTYFHARHPLGRLRCPCCHSSDVIRRGVVVREFLMQPIGRRPSILVFRIQRLGCRQCGAVQQERLPFADPCKRYTRAFARYVESLCHIGTTKDVARHLGISWDLVREIDEACLRRFLKKIRIDDAKFLGIDEFAIGKGHRYMTVVLNMETGAVLYAAEGKGMESVLPFLRKLKRRNIQIEAFVTDMGRAYPSAIEEIFPDADLVYDRFHVVKLMNDKLSKLRRDLQRESEYLHDFKVVKGIRWLLLKNVEKLDVNRGEPERLLKALELNKPLATAYYMKEQLRMLWEFDTREEAESHLKQWIADAVSSGINVLKSMAKTLQKNRVGILNWYKHRITNGPLEGFNNKAQTVKRQAYGYRNMDYFKLKLLTLHQKKYALTG